MVAMSRARLGLYIFGRAELFANCYELRPAMKQLLDRPQQLHLHTSERLVSCRRNLSTHGKPTIVAGLPELAGLVGQMAAQWEAKAQQEATRMGTSTTEIEEDGEAVDAAAATAGPAASEISMPAVAATGQLPKANPKGSIQQVVQADQGEGSVRNHATVATAAHDAETGSSGAVQERPGPAVDANVEPAMDDIVADAKASDVVAGVTDEPNASNADAAEHRRQKKTRTSVQ